MNLSQCIGLGVAGNFAKHLEQAGESKDFVNVAAAEGAPKGIFPFYLPNHDSLLQLIPFPAKRKSQPEPKIHNWNRKWHCIVNSVIWMERSAPSLL